MPDTVRKGFSYAVLFDVYNKLSTKVDTDVSVLLRPTDLS